MKEEEKKKRGRGQPRYYPTPEDMQIAIDEYFKLNPDNPTICGLALHLGFNSRQSFLDYKNLDNGDYSDIISRGKFRVEAAYERDLRDKTKARGCQFALGVGLKWDVQQDPAQTEPKGQLNSAERALIGEVVRVLIERRSKQISANVIDSNTPALAGDIVIGGDFEANHPFQPENEDSTPV